MCGAHLALLHGLYGTNFHTHATSGHRSPLQFSNPHIRSTPIVQLISQLFPSTSHYENVHGVFSAWCCALQCLFSVSPLLYHPPRQSSNFPTDITKTRYDLACAPLSSWRAPHPWRIRNFTLPTRRPHLQMYARKPNSSLVYWHIQRPTLPRV